MTFGSLFAGIGGFDLALTRSGMVGMYAAERDEKCNSVRRRHWPDETQLTDVTLVDGGFRPDLVCAGWPCQGNSVEGKRAGMADPRSGLWGEVVRILGEQRPCWFLGENVPGILSVNGGRDWAAVLADLGRLGYGFAYRILDAQWFGVPQRRRRVFVVGCFGDWRRAAEILFESESLPWDSPPRREAGARVAGTIAAGAHPSGFNGQDADRGNVVTHTLRGEGFDASEDGTGRGTPLVVNSPTCHHGRNDASDALIPFCERQVTSKHNRSNPQPGGPCHTLHEQPPSVAYQCHGSNVGPMGLIRAGNGNAAGGVPFIACDYANGAFEQHHLSRPLTNSPDRSRGAPIVKNAMGVRRLMPIECERLQGFPDDWTRYGANGEEMSDSTRYRMCGNAVAVPCVDWIARRLMEAHPE